MPKPSRAVSSEGPGAHAAWTATATTSVNIVGKLGQVESASADRAVERAQQPYGRADDSRTVSTPGRGTYHRLRAEVPGSDQRGRQLLFFMAKTEAEKNKKKIGAGDRWIRELLSTLATHVRDHQVRWGGKAACMDI